MRKPKQLLCLAMLFFCQLVWAQTKTISGKVTDSKSGAPIGGVSVHVKGTSSGTVTGADGNFTLAFPKKQLLLFFRIWDTQAKRLPSVEI